MNFQFLNFQTFCKFKTCHPEPVEESPTKTNGMPKLVRHDVVLVVLLLIFNFSLLTFNCRPAAAAPSTLDSSSYRVKWPNVNIGAGGSSGPSFGVTTTAGQIAPGLYSSTGFRVKAGFQYIYSIIPFAFSVSNINLNFGSLTTDVLTNEKSLTLKVNSGSAGGYQVLAQESQPLSNGVGLTIPDTACDSASCDQNTAGNWVSTSTYGFGYTITGTDTPTEFTGGTKFKRFALPSETPVKVMGLTPLTGLVAGTDKTAIMTMRINISAQQPSGVFTNVIKFIAIPTY